MLKTLLTAFSNSSSGNRKSKIHNRKWLRVVANVVTFAFGEAVAQGRSSQR